MKLLKGNSGKTIAEKILNKNAPKKTVSPGEYIEASIDLVMVHETLGINIVIAESFARIYFRNLINLGVPALKIMDVKK